MRVNFLTLLLLFGLSAQAQTDAFEKRSYTGKKGNVLSYRLLYPKNYDKKAKQKYPLVLFLHGAGERGNDNEKQLTHGSKLFLSEKNRADFPAFVVFPQCPQESYWSSVQIDRSKRPMVFTYNYRQNDITWPLQSALDLVRQLAKDERVDKRRIYIMGLSMGGMGTFEAISRQPKRFAAAAPICGGGDTTYVKKYARRMPLWVFHGDADDVVPVALSRQMVRNIQNVGGTVQYTEYPGVNHNSWDKAFAEPNLLIWLFGRQK